MPDFLDVAASPSPPRRADPTASSRSAGMRELPHDHRGPVASLNRPALEPRRAHRCLKSPANAAAPSHSSSRTGPTTATGENPPTPEVEHERRGPTAILTANRPDHRNRTKHTDA